ncbi:MAG TPA: DNA gyrase inhibitor YacG [Pyrinomonadaceae bacterium]|nr:DNA gyrase inhibitor YacG [Pyrinomonadaceae bacterium]
MPVVKCPTCGKETQYESNEFRPFCSERCKLLDFGAWADEQYSVPDVSTTPSEEDIAEIERALREKEKK